MNIKFASMRCFRICTPLIAICLASLLAESFGEILMIRRPPEPFEVQLTCASEDDGAALVWNDDLDLPTPGPKEFLPKPFRSSYRCAIAKADGCLALWGKTSKWKFVDSLKYPMAPVFDFRWEDFLENTFSSDSAHGGFRHVGNINRSGTVVLSARNAETIDLTLCPHNKPSNASCIGIFLRPINVTNKYYTSRKFSEVSCNGRRPHPKSPESLIIGHEWFTYVVQWDETLKELKAYESTHPELTMANKTFEHWKNLTHLFIKIPRSGRVRFHSYEYFLTTKENSKLFTNQFTHDEEDFCIELVVALCPSCELAVSAVNSEGDSIFMGYISGVENSVNGKLLTWQVVKLNARLSKVYQNSTKLEIMTRMDWTEDQGQWAIGNLRLCKSVDDVRQSKISVSIKQYPNSNCFTPITQCQKLSNKENAIVSSHAEFIDNNFSSLQESLRDRRDPVYKFGSKDATESWKGTSICNPSGCICAAGFTGGYCNIACPDDYHGYNCQERCGSCKNGFCEKSNGSCINGCNDYYLPPDCKTKLRMPAVRGITDTTASVYYSPGLNSEEADNLSFQIKITEKNYNSMTVNGQWTIATANSGNSTETTIVELAPGTTYIVQVVVTMKRPIEATFVGPEANFTTTCTEPSVPLKLNITTQGRGVVTLEWDQPEYSSAKIVYFEIHVDYRQTRLTKVFQRLPITHNHYKKDNRLMLDLHTSTQYNFFVRALSKCGYSRAASRTYWVPRSIGFPDGEDMVVRRNRTFIRVTIPPMVNATVDSTAKVIVKGSPICADKGSLQTVPDNLRELVNMTVSETGWIAATFPVRESGPKYLTIGNDPENLTLENCRLSPTETYVVIVVVLDKFDQTSDFITSSTIGPIYSTYDVTRGEPYLIWLVVFSMLLACLLLLLYFYRRRQNYYARMESLPSVNYDNTQAVKPPGDCSSDCYPHSVTLKEFEHQVQMAVQNGKLESEFAMLPIGLMKSYRSGNFLENKPKNRYGNLIAYDETRVILEKDTGDFYSDYINANYIQGYRKERAYIATQGPTSNTIADFWRMIWQEEVRVICMLVNVVEDGEKMCEQYWPKVGRTVKYGDIAILNVKQRVYAEYTYRTFQITTYRKAESRKVEHLQYTGWPKTGVPMYSHSIVEYLNDLRSIDPGPGPIVVHCSAGTGRTGTIILCDICLNYTDAEGKVNLFAEAQKMYNARANMLDNLQQYILAHLMPTQCLRVLPTKLPCSDVSQEKIEELKMDLPIHIKRLEASTWKDKALCSSEPLRLPNPEHLTKNRFPKFIPVKHSLVKLRRYPIHDSSSDYISAISVDGVRVAKQYLASQLPLPSTLSDFWRLVAEQKVELIVILQRPSAEDLSCVDIIPHGTTFIPVPFITVENKQSFDSNEHFTTDHLLLTETSEEQARTQNITVLTCNDWKLVEDAKPPSPETLVALWSASERVSRTEGPTLVLCHDGVTGCGLYMALSVLLERMRVEQECDVILAVRVVRRSRAEFVYSKEQFEYLYDAAVHFAESFKTYSNFA